MCAELVQVGEGKAVNVTVRLTPRLYSRLVLVAHRHEQTLGETIRDGLQEFVDAPGGRGPGNGMDRRMHENRCSVAQFGNDRVRSRWGLGEKSQTGVTDVTPDPKVRGRSLGPSALVERCWCIPPKWPFGWPRSGFSRKCLRCGRVIAQ